MFDANVPPVFTIVRAGRTISCLCSLACGLPFARNVENGETVSSFSHARCMGLDVEDPSWLRWCRDHASTLYKRGGIRRYPRISLDTLAHHGAWLLLNLAKPSFHGADRLHRGLDSLCEPQPFVFLFPIRLGTHYTFIYLGTNCTFFPANEFKPLPHRAGEDPGGLKDCIPSEGSGHRHARWEP